MRLPGILCLPTLVACSPLLLSSTPDAFIQTSNILENDFDTPVSSLSWPSIHESALQARRILKLHGISTLSTVFPRTTSPHSRTPASVAGAAIGLMDYHASCGPKAHDPTVLAVTIATTMRNAAAGSNVTLSMRYHLPDPPSPRLPPDPWAYLAANLPRFSLVGYLERIPEDEIKRDGIADCFFDVHEDARIWAPGGEVEPHEAWWARLVVQEVYFFGGFGDRARIGWLPPDVWRGISEEEVEKYRMIGEEGWEAAQAEYKTREMEMELRGSMQRPVGMELR